MKTNNTKKVVKLTESDLTRIVKRVIKEQADLDINYIIDYTNLFDYINEVLYQKAVDTGNISEKKLEKLERLTDEIADSLMSDFEYKLSDIADEYRYQILRIFDEQESED